MTKTFDHFRAVLGQDAASRFSTHAPKLRLILLGLSCVLLAPVSRAQTLPAPSLARRPMVGPVQVASPAVSAPASAAAPAIARLDQPVDMGAPADPPTPVAPKPPRVSYKEGQLTISAENSTLSDILASLHIATGADIDMPPGAAGDHFWVNLGPGPARKVLADLLSETRLDFIIQAADPEKNPDGIASVSLTQRTDAPSATARVMTPTARPLPTRQSDAERRVPGRAAAESRSQEDTVAAAAQDPTVSNVTAEAAPIAAVIPAQPVAAAPAADTQSADSIKPPAAAANPMFQTLQDLYAARKQMQTAPAATATPTGAN